MEHYGPYFGESWGPSKEWKLLVTEYPLKFRVFGHEDLVNRLIMGIIGIIYGL